MIMLRFSVNFQKKRDFVIKPICGSRKVRPKNRKTDSGKKQEGYRRTQRGRWYIKSVQMKKALCIFVRRMDHDTQKPNGGKMPHRIEN